MPQQTLEKQKGEERGKTSMLQENTENTRTLARPLKRLMIIIEMNFFLWLLFLIIFPNPRMLSNIKVNLKVPI